MPDFLACNGYLLIFIWLSFWLSSIKACQQTFLFRPSCFLSRNSGSDHSGSDQLFRFLSAFQTDWSIQINFPLIFCRLVLMSRSTVLFGQRIICWQKCCLVRFVNPKSLKTDPDNDWIYRLSSPKKQNGDKPFAYRTGLSPFWCFFLIWISCCLTGRS